ncbi:MAG: DNA polymerase I [Deltaproteobacteria bacterium]|nr:DNA polymerase I [Deltaproteobacteria bacterium]
MSLRQRLGLSADPIFLMDGSAYIFRGFYANQSMSRADGTPTNVLFMVLRLIFKILREESPAHFAFVLDGKGKNFRHRLYADYKAHRMATPEPLAAQIAPLCEVLRDLGLLVTVSEDCEADDCIASLAARFSQTAPVIIIAADKDLKQCLNPNVYLWDPAGKDEKLTSLQGFIDEIGFEPRYWPDYQAIMGDSSDNIPGVPGIGAKGAGTLMREFKGLEDIFSRLPAVPPALRKKLEGQKEIALLSRQLTTLKLDACPDLSLDQLRPQPPKQRELMDFLTGYELRSLARELSSMLRISGNNLSFASLPGALEAQNRAIEKSHATIQATATAATTIASAAAPAATSATTTPATAKSASRAAASAEQGFLWSKADSAADSAAKLSAGSQASLLDFAEAASDLQANLPDDSGKAYLDGLPRFRKATDLPVGGSLALLFARDLSGDKADTRILIGNGKQEFIFHPATPAGPDNPPSPEMDELLAALNGKRLAAPEFKALCEACPALRKLPLADCFDLSLAAWLLSPEEYDYSFKKLARRWGPEAAARLQEKTTPLTSSLILSMAALLAESLKANQLDGLMRDLEMPLIPVLLDMQKVGLGIDQKAFAAFLELTEKELAVLSEGIYQDAGRIFNIRSAKQLGEILFDDLGLPKARKTSGGQASTSQEALEKLAGKHPILDKLLEFRKLEKLRSTYLDPLPRLADAQGRLHTSFNQSSTATGRLSSSNPNLQNIPVRGPLGAKMRACFTAAPGNLLVSSDYSQIELRVLAHLSQDPTLLDAFSNNEDIHRRTASLLFETQPDQITPDQRRSAKTINFGLIYGMGPQKLARELGISLSEASGFIERYFAKLGKLKEYFEKVEEDAKTHGYVTSMTGRRRPCPEILSANQQLRSRARRQAINTCIQGSAADIIKLAMLAAAADAGLKELGSTLILQIHDELLLECPVDNAEAAGKRLAKIMSAVKPGGQELLVPLACDWGIGENWAEAH